MGFLAILVFSCKSKTDESLYYIKYCQSADSIVHYYEDNASELPRNFLYNIRHRLVSSKKGTEADKILNFIDAKRVQGGVSEIDEAYYNFGQGLYYLYQDTQKTGAFLRKVPVRVANSNDSFSLAYYNVLGQYYYLTNRLNLALDIMQLAYSAAIELGDTVEMGRMATNLGGLNSILGFDQAAGEYLIRSQSYDPKNLILANNLASVLIGQKQFTKAKEILDRFAPFLTNKNPNAEQIIYRLTYVHLLQELGNWDDARTVIKGIDVRRLPPVQVYNYYSFELLQLEHDEGGNVDAYMDVILSEKGPSGYSELFYYLSGWSTRVKMNGIQEHFLNHISSLDTSVFDLLGVSVYYNLQSKAFKRQGNIIKSAQMETESARFLKDYYAELLESKKTDMTNRLDLFDLERKYAKNKHDSEAVNLHLKINNIILFFGTVLLLVILYAYFRQRLLTQRNNVLSKDLFRQKQSELEILEREKETTKKLVELSTRILETSKELKSKLINLPEKNLPGIRESLEDLDYILFLNKSVDTTVIAKGYDFSKVDFLSDLIDSQRQVLSLSLDNYRPKEIAVTLNLSYSYVRNVQSRLRKKIKDEGYDTFEALKADLGA
jgi:DNA-binding CsgD family transcriptional regulator